MTAPGTGPCSAWITWAEVGGYCTPGDLPAGVQTLVQPALCALASRWLWEATGRQFGTCTVVKSRPVSMCHHECRGVIGCTCGQYFYLPLGREPVVSIEGVWIDGVLIDPSTYHVDEWHYLVRDDEPWPHCQDLAAPSGSTGTFEVSYTYGQPVPVEGVMAAALLVCKWSNRLADACNEIPSTAERVIREGFTQIIKPPSVQDGESGNQLVDLWIASVPKPARSRLFDPSAGRTVWRSRT